MTTSASSSLRLIAADQYQPDPVALLTLANDADPLAVDLDGIHVIELQFPAFTDGRAFSQAFLLRKRLGFQGEIRATGDVLIDQLPQMQRSGFDVAALRADQSLALAQQVLAVYPGHRVGKYQGDATSRALSTSQGQPRSSMSSKFTMPIRLACGSTISQVARPLISISDGARPSTPLRMKEAASFIGK